MRRCYANAAVNKDEEITEHILTKCTLHKQVNLRNYAQNIRMLGYTQKIQLKNYVA